MALADPFMGISSSNENSFEEHFLQCPWKADQKLETKEMFEPINVKEPGWKLKLSYKIELFSDSAILGRGGYSTVFIAVDIKSGQVVALKKARVSLKVKRTILKHESRVLQLLQGHPAIPKIYGYGQLVHFDYISMEILGPSVREKATGSMPVITVIRFIEQALSALKYVHKFGLVHRDIKPENFLCSNDDPSKIMLIDFGLAKFTSSGPPRTYDPLKEKKHIVGTLHWASLNSHRGIDLAPRDDLESLAYTALFLLRSDVPWREERCRESILRSQARIHKIKASVSGSQLSMHFPADFAYLLDYSRGINYHQMPDYDDLESRFSRLAESLGGYSKDNPLDWTPLPIVVETEPKILDQSEFEEDDADYEDSNGDSGLGRDSYCNWDIDWWDDRNGERNMSLTLPIQLEELADIRVPSIIEVKVLES